MPYTKVIGHRYNERSWEVRQFLARNEYSFRSVNADEPKGQQLLEAAGLDDSVLPVVITEKGETLVEPTDGELATLLGLSTSPSLEMYDLAVIGGGPAGLAAAVYGASEGLKTVLIEKATTGGQAGRSSRIENYLGFANGVVGRRAHDDGPQAGRAFRRRGHHDAGGRQARGRRGRRRALDPAQRRQHDRRARGHPRHRRRLPPAADHRLLGRPRRPGAATTSAAASTTAPRCRTTAECAGEDVYIVGGANSAGQAAMFMSQTAKSVTHADPRTVARGRRCRSTSSSGSRRTPNIIVRTCTEVVDTVAEDDQLKGLVLVDRRTGETEEVPCDRMCCFIGATPRTEWLEDAGIARDDYGFILSGPDRDEGERLDARPSAASSGNKRAGCVRCR